MFDILTDFSLPRLKGGTLKRLRGLLRYRLVESVLRDQFSEMFQLDELASLPEEARDGFDESTRPRNGGPPRHPEEFGAPRPVPPDHRVSASQIREAYRNGETTPTEVFDVVARCIRSEEFGTVTHSPFAATRFDAAREAAEASDARWERAEPLGPLDGVPVVVKDHLDIAGMRTGIGTTYRGEFEGEAEADAEIIRRLKQGGAIIIGKTHMTECGLQPTGFNPHFAMPRNPYASDRAAGGSSTGTAAAVGLGLVPVGHGSDTGGSIRIPAAVSGVFGIKPTYLRMSRVGDALPHETMTHNGVLGQSTSDLVDFLAVTGWPPDPEDPSTEYEPRDEDVPETWRASLEWGIDHLTIGLWSWAFRDADDALCQPALDTVRALEEQGAEVVEVEIDYASYHQPVGALVAGLQSAGNLRDAVDRHGDEMGADLRLMLQALGRVNARDYLLATKMRAVLRRHLAETFEEIDLLVSPATNTVAPKYEADETFVPIYDDAAMRGLGRYAFLGNLTGVPAGTVPIGLVDGLPVGMQLIGDAFDEGSVFAAMAECERLGLTALPRPDGFVALADSALR